MKQKDIITRGGEVRPTDATRSATRLYLKHANPLIFSFDSWKDNPRYYYIELGLDMAYCIGGLVARIAEPPYHLGTIVRNSRENSGLFSFRCPECGETVFSSNYNGSPLSGRFDLSGLCPSCGWKGYVSVSGWRVRSEALRAVQKKDLRQLRRVRFWNPGFKPASIEELLREIGVPEDDLVLPPEAGKEIHVDLPNGDVFVSRPGEGSVVIKKSGMEG